MLVSWSALLVSSWLVGESATSYYKTHYVRAFSVPSASMEPAVAEGDFVLTNNSAYRADGPRRGDIVVFKYPQPERREAAERSYPPAADIPSAAIPRSYPRCSTGLD